MAVAVVVIIVVASIRRDNFQSMVRRDELLNARRAGRGHPAAHSLISPHELDVPYKPKAPFFVKAQWGRSIRLYFSIEQRGFAFRKPESVFRSVRNVALGVSRKGPPFFVRQDGAVR